MNREGGYTLNIKGKLFTLNAPKVMAIINVTPDSFYADARSFDKESIKKRVDLQMRCGADILDVGGCSSRPGAPEISQDEEYSRLSRALEVIRKDYPDAIVSVDTYRASIARRCVEEWGVDIVNDISGGTLDEEMFPTIASLRVPYVLTHMRGRPDNMHEYVDYDDVAADVLTDLSFKARRLHELGVTDVIIDPGFGFAKNLEQNYRLMSALPVFKELGMPLLVGVSHKSMIWKPLDLTPETSGEATVALDAMALMLGADIIRVHEVAPAVQTVKMYNLLKNNSI